MGQILSETLASPEPRRGLSTWSTPVCCAFDPGARLRACSPAADPAEPLSLTRRDWAALLTIGFGVSLVIMDATIVNVALPVVIEDLSLTATEAQRMNAVYSLVFASLLITVGRVGDPGRRRLFLIGMCS